MVVFAVEHVFGPLPTAYLQLPMPMPWPVHAPPHVLGPLSPHSGPYAVPPRHPVASAAPVGPPASCYAPALLTATMA